MIAKTEIQNLLEEISNKKVELLAQRDPSSVVSGNITYLTSNGWEITIYIDSGAWDYIDFIRNPNGAEMNFEKLDEIEELRNYYPSKETCINIFKVGFEN